MLVQTAEIKGQDEGLVKQSGWEIQLLFHKKWQLHKDKPKTNNKSSF